MMKGTLETYRAIRECNSTRELDEITGADRGVLGQEGDQVVDTVVNTSVGVEVGFHGREEKHGAVRSSTTKMQC